MISGLNYEGIASPFIHDRLFNCVSCLIPRGRLATELTPDLPRVSKNRERFFLREISELCVSESLEATRYLCGCSRNEGGDVMSTGSQDLW